MRFAYRYLLLCLALAICLQSVVGAPYAAIRRQDDNLPDESSTTATARESASQRPSATPTPTDVSSSLVKSVQASSTVTSSVQPSETPAASTTSNASNVSMPTPTSSASGDSKSVLPIVPTLTPAMGISGVFLLISGLVYALIGIKNRWIYVSGSAAYLSALAVTVLIVYLMNPPVSNAIQGAFFVAAFFTGVIFGVLSLVFSDITEGFGCLLGGFCLSMWFLSLRDGGLIHSSTGRAIFIGCMAAGGYSLSFSRYTRTYGLIGSIAFAGATATILGIDCLAGSGWKEFWLYLWNLNDAIFPLNTNTYPITKNMKAELAGVVIIAVVGIVSQMRVWNMVKEHREKSAAQQLERQQDNDREEEELGRKVEDNFQKERAQWEAAYAGKSMPDASVRSSVSGTKASASVQEKGVYDQDSLEMTTLSNGGITAAVSDDTMPGTAVTVSVLQDDDIQPLDAQGNTMVSSNRSESDIDRDAASPDTPDLTSRPTLVKRNSLRPSAPPPPPSVIPLPFKVPDDTSSHSDEDNASIEAEPEADIEDSESKLMSKRISDVSAMRQRFSRDIAASQEALIGAHQVDDDGASSVAATLDDDDEVLSVRALSRTQSPIGTEHDDTPEAPDTVVPDEETTKELEEENDTTRNDAPSTSAIRQSLTASTDPKHDEQAKKRPSMRDSVQADTVASSSRESTADQPSRAESHTEIAESHIGSLKDGLLPERMSKIALSYRTNEWAKHLEAAEKPDYEDISQPSSPGIMLADGTEEQAAPVSDELVAPLHGNNSVSKRSSSGSKMQRQSSGGLQRNASTFSQDSLISKRSYTQSPIASPGGLPRSSSATRLDILSPLPKKTLLSKRETLIKNRASSLTLNRRASTTLLADANDKDDMTLAQRRSLLQQQPTAPTFQRQTSQTSTRRAPPSTSQKWQSKGMLAQGAPPGFNSHQPRRNSGTQSDQKREQLYAGWRDSVRSVESPQTAAYIVEQQRAALLNERRQKEIEKQQREMMQQQRASQMENMMRSGAMMDAHREAMRRMQANANKNANSR